MKVFEVIRESKYNDTILVATFGTKEETQEFCDKMNAAVKLDKMSGFKYSYYERVLPSPRNWITYKVTFFDGLRDPDPVIEIFNRDNQFHTGDVIIHTVSRNIIVYVSIIIDSEITREKVIALAKRIILRE